MDIEIAISLSPIVAMIMAGCFCALGIAVLMAWRA